MAQYTFEVFRWSGNGYNSQYDTSHTATISDNDDNYEGRGDTDEQISIDGGAEQASSGPPYTIDVSFTDTSGQPHVESFEFFNTGGSWYFIAGPDSEFSVGATLGSYQSHTIGWSYDDVACFCNGSVIRTTDGNIAVENLSAGMWIKTLDGPPARLNKILQRTLTPRELNRSPKLRPICIEKNALGRHLPNRALRVSPQHRMLISSKAAKRMFGASDVLVAAHRLVDLPEIYREDSVQSLTYFHLVFAKHQIIFANGAPSESYYPGPQALQSLNSAAREEFATLFPSKRSKSSAPRFARPVPSVLKQKRLIQRHVKNKMPLLA